MISPHTKANAKSPHTNGICEWFHKSVLQELYQVAFQKKLYDSTMRCGSIWTTGYVTTPTSARITANCVAAERPSKLWAIGQKLDVKSSQIELRLTGAAGKTATCQIASEPLRIMHE